MNTRSGIEYRLYQITVIVLMAILLLAAMPIAFASAAPLIVANAIDGDGVMTVSPISVTYGSVTDFTFTFMPTTGRDFVAGSSVELTIPSGWTTPVTTSGAGLVTVNAGTCTLNGAPPFSVVGM
ncbi:MAG: hypothetical protein PHQ36_08640, partial [Anaerolineales bacterium]|nr:hypothetical protein [Anaerolineales bacterium]